MTKLLYITTISLMAAITTGSAIAKTVTITIKNNLDRSLNLQCSSCNNRNIYSGQQANLSVTPGSQIGIMSQGGSTASQYNRYTVGDNSGSVNCTSNGTGFTCSSNGVLTKAN